MDSPLNQEDPTVDDQFRDVTNDAEMLAFSIFFSLFIVIMIWQMQIFRGVFCLKENNSIYDPSRLVKVHLLILIFLIFKITTCAYALISARIDYSYFGIFNQHAVYFNPSVYALMLNVCLFSQAAAYTLTIKNWLQVIQRIQNQPQPLVQIVYKFSIPALMLTFVIQVIFVVLLVLKEKQFIVQASGIVLTILYVIMTQLLSLGSWSICVFFKHYYTNCRYLIRAIIFLNLGLQLRLILNVIIATNPEMIEELKGYNEETKIDESINWALTWSFEQLVSSIIPVICTIILTRPRLFVIDGVRSYNNSVFKSYKLGFSYRTQSNISQVHQTRISKTYSLNNNEEYTSFSNAQNDTPFVSKIVEDPDSVEQS